MMGNLASLDTYTDPATGFPMGGGVQPEAPQDPRAFTSDWAWSAATHPDPYEPRGTQWPQYPPAPPKEVVEDRPNPLIPFSAYRSLPPKHRVGDIAAQNIIEQGPAATGFGLATGAMLRGAGPLARSTAGGVVGSAEPGEAQSAVRDPRLWSRLSSVMLRKPISEMEHTYTGLPSPQVPRILRPEQLLGETGIFTPWDIARTGGNVTSIDGNALARAVALHGGPGFPQANPGLAAASEHAISSRLDNEAAKITERTGKPPLIIPITMGGSGVDASHHVAGPLSQLVQTAPILKRDLREFNTTMRERVAAMEKEKDPANRKKWMSTDRPAFQDYIDNMEGGMKVKSLMAKVMEQKYWQDKGFPNVAAVRHAVSEPNLIDLPTNTGGMAISRYTPGQGLIDTSHPSYSKGVAGQHMGQLASMVPFETFGPSIAEGLAIKNAANKAAGKKVAITPAYHLGKPSEGIPTSQYFDEPWLENFMKHSGEQ